MRKYGSLLLLCVAMCLLLTGCGEKTADETEEKTENKTEVKTENATADEAQLKNDLYSSDMFSRYANDLNMEITELEVTKRQTDEEQKKDSVWVHVNASSDAVDAEMYYIMTYALYNEGWLLETVWDDEYESWHFTPLRGVSDDVIANDLQQSYSEYEILNNEVDLESGIQTVTFITKESHLYCTKTATMQLIYEFTSIYEGYGMTLDGEWWSRFQALDSNTVWNLQKICGTYQNGKGDILTISSLDESVAGTENSNNGMVYERVGILTYSWSSQSDRKPQTDNLLKVANVSATDFHSYWKFSNADVEYYIALSGYSVTCDSFNWSDVAYVVPRGFYITPDGIYGNYSWTVSNQNRTLHLKADGLTRIG